MMLRYEENYRLDTELVDTQGVADSVNLVQEYRREPGWYTVQVEGKLEQPSEVVYDALQQALVKLVQQLEQPIDPGVLARARARFKAAIVSETQTIEERGDFLAEVQMMSGDPHAMDDHIAALETVTSEDVLRVARKYLNPDKAVVGFLEPTPDASEPLSPQTEPIKSFVLTEPVGSLVPDALIDPVSLEEVTKYLPPLTDSAIALNQALPEKVVLKNGLQVLLLPDHEGQAVTMRGWVDAGDRFDPEGKAGTAFLTARSLANDAQSEEEISFYTTTDLDGVNMSAEIETENLMVGLETVANYLQNPIFLDDRFEEKQQQLSDRNVKELTDTANVNRLALQQAIYPEGHPAHQIKTTKSISTISPADLRTFYGQHYRPDNTVIALAGKFDSTQVKSQIAQVLGNWRVQGKAPTLVLPSGPMPEESVYLKREISEVLDDISGAHTVMGHGTISRNNPRYYALVIANEILGGSRSSSRLSDSLIDQQGLVYSGAMSRFNAGRDHGDFEISINTTEAENMNQAIASVIAVLKQAKTEGITAGELRIAKQSLVSHYARALTSSGNLAGAALEAAVHRLDEGELQAFPEKIRAVTLEEAQAAIETLIDPDKMVVVTSTTGG